MIFRNGERLLWNPLTKKAARFRPEERVRLQFIEYLIQQSDIPASRISVETPVPSRFNRGRTDVLCYDDRFNPFILVECKADHIIPGPGAAMQSAKYNRFVKAPYILLTNGVQQALYDVSASLNPLNINEYPSELHCRDLYLETSVDYWKSRGFLAQNIPDYIASPFAIRLAALFQTSGETISFLDISHPTDRMPLSHYYILLSVPEYPDTLLAVTLRSIDQNEMILCAISNRNKRNTGCLRIQISQLGEFYNAQLFLIDSHDTTTPDITRLESAWNRLENIAQYENRSISAHPGIPSELLCFSDTLISMISPLFFSKHHN